MMVFIDTVDLDAERRLWRFGYVNGHDGLVHRSNSRGFTICGMGRGIPTVYVENGPASCFRCLCDNPWGDF